jgi:hypothetical protein
MVRKSSPNTLPMNEEAARALAAMTAENVEATLEANRRAEASSCCATAGRSPAGASSSCASASGARGASGSRPGTSR